jgi:hypothetical protein
MDSVESALIGFVAFPRRPEQDEGFSDTLETSLLYFVGVH